MVVGSCFLAKCLEKVETRRRGGRRVIFPASSPASLHLSVSNQSSVTDEECGQDKQGSKVFSFMVVIECCGTLNTDFCNTLPQLLALYCTQLQPSCKWNRVTDLLKIAVRDAAICPHTDTKN